MAGIPHPYFDWDDTGPPTGRDNAIGHLRACMRGRTLKWFDDEITTKQNWEVTNLFDNTGQANLVAVNGRTAVQIGANALNEAVGQPGNAIVKLRAVEDAWNEDWRIAGGHPTNAPVNAPNANAGNTIVVAGIRFGQAVWWLKTHFPTVEEELRDLMYGTIRKGDLTIDELYRKILRIGRRANYRPEELRRKFLDALPLLWLEKAEDIDEHLPLDELAKKLYEIELRRIARHKKDRLPDPLVSNRASRQIYEPSPVLAPQQQGISLEDMQKAIQNALAQQKTENQTLVKKPRGPPSSLKTEEGLKNYYVSEYLKEIGLLSKEDLDSDYPVKSFQRPRPQRNNNSARFDRIEEGLEETRNNVNQLADLFQKKIFIQKCGICEEMGHSKGSCPKRPIAQSKLTRSYFTPLTPIVPPDSDGEKNGGGDYDEDDNRWIGYDPPLLSKLSPPIRKMCLSRKVQEEESKESDEWLSSLQYLNTIINDLTISKSFLDTASEFGGINDPAIKALRWKADKPSNFAIKGNSKYTYPRIYTLTPIFWYNPKLVDQSYSACSDGQSI
ncbi:uncharacterized protein OCT59_029683 [Rhizophagus irregularis]|uniref:uncharacterized protein n=1 Tax=Rhizophagus irregularis TaxID=588596 RepID=UPI003330800A|nr:hypothetical protein OCT59_029683 [Rhizophagus irregularis]